LKKERGSNFTERGVQDRAWVVRGMPNAKPLKIKEVEKAIEKSGFKNRIKLKRQRHDRRHGGKLSWDQSRGGFIARVLEGRSWKDGVGKPSRNRRQQR